MSSDSLWREACRLENRILASFDTDLRGNLDKVIDSNDEWKDLCIRALRQVKTLQNQIATRPTQSNNEANNNLDATDPFSAGFKLLAKEFSKSHNDVIKARG
eukprot:GHVR01001063.1.p2 GENE.GHVR01001063.1~~GHVR01001063.1.p2  ORF type:complete len:102 (+),score=15.25 GHVR01001063.1:611-916(+)